MSTLYANVFSIAPMSVLDGISARVVHGDSMSFGIFEVEPEAPFPLHSHPNEQIGTVIRGSMMFAEGDGWREVRPGSIWCIPEGEPHSGKGGPEGAIVVEVFAPVRTEWRDRPVDQPRTPLWPPAPGAES